MLRNTCEFVTGRLLEIRVAAGYRTVADVDQVIAVIVENVSPLPAGEKYTIAADWRAGSSHAAGNRCQESRDAHGRQPPRRAQRDPHLA